MNPSKLISLFTQRTGYTPDLDNPRSYCEKALYDKLHNRDERYVLLSNKFRAKQYIRGKSQALPIPTIGVGFERNLDNLPVMMKPNNSSGQGRVIQTTADYWAAHKKFTRLSDRHYGADKGEWHYSKIPFQVIHEPVLQGFDELKFFCFDGRVRYVYLVSGKSRSFFDTKGNYMQVEQRKLGKLYPSTEKRLPELDLDKMIRSAEKLSEGLSQVRVDLLWLQGSIYFTEFTFYHMSGMIEFIPREFDYQLGSHWKL